METFQTYYDARDGCTKYDYQFTHPDGTQYGCQGAPSLEDAREIVKQQMYDRYCNLIPVTG